MADPTIPSINDLRFEQLENITRPTKNSRFNPSLSITESTVGSDTVTTIVKTIDGVTYTKTITESGSNTTISAWV